MWRLRLCLCVFLVGMSTYVQGDVTEDPSSEPTGDRCDVVEYCTTCDNPELQCLHCEDGYEPAANNLTCHKCPNFCEKCRVVGSGTECTTCIGGYYKIAKDKSCKPCPGGCSTCKEGDYDEGECTVCAAGFHLSEKSKRKCKACSANCAECHNVNNCKTCRAGFYLQSDKTCSECPSGHTNCLICTSAAQCDMCAPGKYWNAAAATCSNCMDYCSSCTNGDTCDNCATNYIRKPGNTECISHNHCEAYEDGSGCTKCNPGYSLDEDTKCTLCPVLDMSTCTQCTSETRGHFWDGTTSKCSYCVADCLSCSSVDDCSLCVSGKIWDLTTESCIACAAANLNSEPKCPVCPGHFWDVGTSLCKDCTEVGAKSIEAGCWSCTTDTQGNFWSSGTCTTLNCGTVGNLNMDECGACPSVYWLNGQCNPVTCTDVTVLTLGPECTTCAAAWTEPTCTDVPCNGPLTSEMSCECSGGTHYWNTAVNNNNGDCYVVNCKSRASDTNLNREECITCGRQWDAGNTACLLTVVDCTQGLATQDVCLACRTSNKYWDGSACQAINCATDTLDSAEKCHACAGKYWNAGTTTCAGSSKAYCTGAFDQEKCIACDGRLWDSGTSACVLTSCLAYESGGEAECKSCPSRYWTNSACSVVQTCSTSLSTQLECEACQHKRYMWETINSQYQCILHVCHIAVTTENACKTCDKTWTAGSCAAVDCSKNQLTEDECDICPGKIWGNNNCGPVNCNNIGQLNTAEECNKCTNTYWESGSSTCVELLDCTAAGIIIDSADRCVYCDKKDTSSTRLWDHTQGVCHVCPLYCLSCSADACIQCVEGKFWDPHSKLCVDCATNSLDDEDKCDQCVGKLWQQNDCIDCIANCDICTNTYTCDSCEEGKIYVAYAQACLDCGSSTSTECISCGTNSLGNYYDDTDLLCYECHLGCKTCSAYDVCETCSSAYYKDDTDTCIACSTFADFDTEPLCDVCGQVDDVSFWDIENEECKSCTGAVINSLTLCALCGASNTYWNSGSSSCPSCVSGCKECNSGDSCQVCDAGKYFDAVNKICTNVASKCTSYTTEGGCSMCDYKFYLKEQSCDPCIAGCDLCDDSDTCIECSSGFCQDLEGKCHATGSKCDMCELQDGVVVCLSCTHEHTFEVCKACTYPHCVKCDEADNKCETCIDGFYVDTNNQCKTCGPHCDKCEDGTTCGTCVAGYYKDEDKCEKCGTHCALCTSATDCTKCTAAHMYTASDGKCEKCATGCDTCSETGCLTCLSGKYYDQITLACEDCIGDCAKCSTATECDTCNGGFFLKSDGLCYLCSEAVDNCHTCVADANDDAVCSYCSGGYAMKDDGSECLECSISKCGYCIDPPESCLLCNTGFILNEDHSECIKGCYDCEGDDEDCVNPGANTTVTACPGIGYSHNCLTTRIEAEESGIVTYLRECSNATCTSDARAARPDSSTRPDCMTASGAKKCSTCCDEHKCNSNEIKSGSIRVHTTYASILICVMFSLIPKLISAI